MGDALLKNTFRRVIPGYVLVADIEVAGSAVTSIEFSALDIQKGEEYLLVETLNSAVSNAVDMYLNGDEVRGNYYAQQIDIDGGSVSGVRENKPDLGGEFGGDTSLRFTKILLTNSGHGVMIARTARRITTSSLFTKYSYISTVPTASTIATIKIKHISANGIGVGSQFQLYKRAAEVVADIVVTADTTSVDITGLNIDENNEYALVSDVTNASSSNSAGYELRINSLGDGYYAQRLEADGTSVTGTAYTIARMCYLIQNAKGVAHSRIKLTNNGFYTATVDCVLKLGLSTVSLQRHVITHNTPQVGITSLQVVASVANAIKAGSRFRLIKLK